MELSFWGACGIVGVGKSDKVITGGASKALPERCKQKIRRLKNSGFQTVEKPLSMIKMGCRVLLALLVLHRAKLLASNQSILALGRSPHTCRQPFVSLRLCIDSHLCRCIVQRLCVADFKHPCLKLLAFISGIRASL